MDPRLTRRLTLSLAPVALLASGVFAQYAGSEPVPKEFKKGFDAVTLVDARKLLGYLAGPECEGRGSGQPGFQKAAEYVAARFKEYGLKPMGDNGTFFQNVPFTKSRIDPGQSSLSIGSNVVVKGLRVSASSDVDVTGDVVFLRVTGPNSQLENPEALKGRVVVVAGAAIPRSFLGQITRSEAAAILTVNPQAGPAGLWSARPAAGGRGGRGGGRNPFASAIRADLTPEEATALAKAEGVSEAAVSLDPGTSDAVALEQGNQPVHIVAKFESEAVGVPNVVGMIEGSDPTLKAEYVGIGAHLDHLGVRPDGTVYWGADDDGSGSTAVMLVAKAIHESGLRPKRSIVFMTFCGEEMGLIGSGYITEHPPVPLEKMIAEFQMDMVGRNSEGVQNGDRNRVDKLEENLETIRLVGSKRISTELHEMILDRNRYVNFKFKYDAEDVYTRSDHYNFARKGIPIAFLFDGFHPDYHQPTDTVDKIDFVKLTNSAKLYYLSVMAAANREKAFAHDVGGGGG